MCVKHKTKILSLNMYNSLYEAINSSLRFIALMKVKENNNFYLTQIIVYYKKNKIYKYNQSKLLKIISIKDSLLKDLKKKN